MPFYEYECSACKFYVEALQKISDPPLVKCPSCGKETLQRLISAPVFRLKGAGWYETDFKSDKENKRNLAEDKEPAKSDGDDKKVKVRASKALKKVAVKKAVGKSAKKAAKKKTSAKPSGKAKGARKQVRKQVARKRPAKGARPSPRTARKKTARKK